MAVNIDALVYAPNFNMFARPCVFTPIASQPGHPQQYTQRVDEPSLPLRAIYNTMPVDVSAQPEVAEIMSDQRTEADVRNSEWPVVPTTRGGLHDLLFFPPHLHLPAAGPFRVVDADSDGEGVTTLALQLVVESDL